MMRCLQVPPKNQWPRPGWGLPPRHAHGRVRQLGIPYKIEPFSQSCRGGNGAGAADDDFDHRQEQLHFISADPPNDFGRFIPLL
jgi:hypothetical protein